MRQAAFLLLFLVLLFLPLIALAQATGPPGQEVAHPQFGIWNLVGLAASAVTGKIIKNKTGDGTKARKRAPVAANLVWGVGSFLANGMAPLPALAWGAVQAFTATGLHSAPKNWMQVRASP